MDLLSQLEAESPVKREVHVEGWSCPVWIWKLTDSQVRDLGRMGLQVVDESQGIDFAVKVCQWSLGDSEQPGCFEGPRGEAYLRRNLPQVMHLSQAIIEFCELRGPNEDREKKSESSADYLKSVEQLEPSTLVNSGIV